MAGLQRFTINPDRIAHETIDGETIVIDLETGAYYSLQGTAAEIWRMLGHGWSSDQVVSDFARRFDQPVADLTGPVQQFVRALVSEELIEQELIERLVDDSSPNPPIVAARSNGVHPGEDFVGPELQKFTDMQYFLALDPIHEVDASGWPHAAAGP
jgi:hypothetical protein